MPNGKRTKSFAFGIFIILIGIVLTYGRISYIISYYQIYGKDLTLLQSNPSLSNPNFSTASLRNEWIIAFSTNIFWIVLLSILIVIGFYVMKSGIIKENMTSQKEPNQNIAS